ncbi:MAG TPA: DUF2062 domain-containing protein [Planctomycetota bacterium]|nr:DUF2062 domain-containing protein [Planctomycetota bacterium]
MFQATRDKIKGFVVWLMMLNDTPHSIAMGVAVGLFVALTPTMGIQMLFVAFVSLFIRCNRTAGMSIVWVTNPLTSVPIFFGNYVIGTWLLRMTPLSWPSFWQRFRDAFAYDRWYERLIAMFRALGRLSLDLAGPLWLGSIVVAAAVSVPAYFVVRRAVVAHRRAHQRRLEAALAAEGDAREDVHEETSTVETLQDR